MPQLIALLRGINVGRAKRIAMADLRALITGLGHANVRTLLNSGNVIFEGPSSKTGDQALRIQNAIAAKLGVSARVSVVTAADLAAIVRENPLQSIANDPSRFLAAFVSDRAVLTKIKPLIHQSWAPDQLAIGSRAAYIWCANGIVESKLLQAFSGQMGEAITTRNWSTVLKLNAATSISSAAQPIQRQTSHHSGAGLLNRGNRPLG